MVPMEENLPADIKHLQAVRHSAEEQVLVAASALTGRYWCGEIRIYSNQAAKEDATMDTVTPVTHQTVDGISDCVWVGESSFITAEDSGSVSLWHYDAEERAVTLKASLTQHHNMALSVDLSADSHSVISAGADYSVRICDMETQSLSHCYRAHTGAVSCVRCHPSDPQMLVTASSSESFVLLWDLRLPKPARVIDVSSIMEGGCTTLAWQPGADLVVGLGGAAGEVALKDLQKGSTKATQQHKPHKRRVTTLAFSPLSPSLLASGSEDYSVVVTEHKCLSMENRLTKADFEDFVSCVSWSPKVENLLLTTSWDGVLGTHTV